MHLVMSILSNDITACLQSLAQLMGAYMYICDNLNNATSSCAKMK